MSEREERSAESIRIAIRHDGDISWMRGEWLDLGEDHAVVFADERCRFVTADGTEKAVGSFPARKQTLPAAFALRQPHGASRPA